MIGTYQCEILNYFYLTDNGGTSIIEVLLKEGQGGDLDVIVTIGGQHSSATITFSYEIPTIIKIEPKHGPTSAYDV